MNVICTSHQIFRSGELEMLFTQRKNEHQRARRSSEKEKKNIVSLALHLLICDVHHVVPSESLRSALATSRCSLEIAHRRPAPAEGYGSGSGLAIFRATAQNTTANRPPPPTPLTTFRNRHAASSWSGLRLQAPCSAPLSWSQRRCSATSIANGAPA